VSARKIASRRPVSLNCEKSKSLNATQLNDFEIIVFNVVGGFYFIENDGTF
jgi:hypothetical protein